VPAKQRAGDAGSSRARAIVADLGREIHAARVDHGLSQAAVARAVRLSPSQISRIERGLVPLVSLANLARLLAVVGLELSARAYPAGSPIHDAAHLALLDRLRRAASPAIAWRFEVPVVSRADGRAGDERAWDAVMFIGRSKVAVETETRPRDVQALMRRVALKRRDSAGVQAVVLVLSNTRHNRLLMRDYAEVLEVDLPARTAEILEALSAGRPPRSGIAML
jgi:transcriptional regulator with XRE-family HTH domain